MSADIAFGQDARDVQIPADSGCTRIARDGKNMCLQDSARVLERMAGMAVQICTPETTRMFVIFLALAVLYFKKLIGFLRLDNSTRRLPPRAWTSFHS